MGYGVVISRRFAGYRGGRPTCVPKLQNVFLTKIIHNYYYVGIYYNNNNNNSTVVEAVLFGNTIFLSSAIIGIYRPDIIPTYTCNICLRCVGIPR